MKKNITNIILLIVISCLLLSGCVPLIPKEKEEVGNEQPVTATRTPFQPSQIPIYLSPGLPAEWKSSIGAIQNVEIVADPSIAELSFSPDSMNQNQTSIFTAKIVFTVAVPFLTVDDDITLDEIKIIWNGTPGIGQYQTLYVSDRTKNMFSDLWGANGNHVKVVSADTLIENLEETENSLALIPFEQITPRLKILKIRGLSPLDKPFNESDYPLIISYNLAGNGGNTSLSSDVVAEFAEIIPQINRDESKMTVVIMSGTTAMARCTASKILLKGTEYPIEMVQDWFLKADIRHVSNEVSVSAECPRAVTCNTTLRLCANPESIEVLEKLGVNVVELTGNHVNDYGTDSFKQTLEMYRERGWLTFGGGMDPEDARKPALIENNGNKIAFIGCNPVGYTSAWAKEGYAGAAKCDYEYLHSKIKELKEEGYVVITTFQHNEIYAYMYSESYRVDFKEAAQVGADIVQGSQAHYPMGFEFIGNSMIHYGLGNFLFDQMDIPVEGTRREFIDRHIIYNGKYINTELMTALLTDWSRPVPMTEPERAQLLKDIFDASKTRFP